ncbi:MAG: transcriptional regulator [Pseudomonadota bacterium]|nr:transcriptional regulator [Pseudomonadota bacterium]
MTDTTNGEIDDEDDPPVFIIIGGVRHADDAEMMDFHALLTAPDDDSAVRRCLEALASEGYDEADLTQIGNIEEPEEDDPFFAPYCAALEGDIALLVYEHGISPD